MWLSHACGRAFLVGLLVAPLLTACGSGDAPFADAGIAASEGKGFEDVTRGAGLGAFRHEAGASGKDWFPEQFGAGGGFFDYDEDGWLDILLVAGDPWTAYVPGEGIPALRLYRNKGDGTFAETTEDAGLANVRAYGFGVTTADYDNDGDDDIFFTTLRGYRLFRNDPGSVSGAGSRRFVDVSGAAGVSGPSEWGTAALFFDADRDGWLDLYVGNYTEWTPEGDVWCTVDGKTKGYCKPQDYEGVAGRYFHNNGNGTFTDRTEEAGFLPAPGKTLGVAELDYNGDRWPDLVVANDTEPTLLYANDGDGTFTEKGVIAGVAFDDHGRARAGMGIDAADLDNSGEPTIIVSKFSAEMIGMYRHEGEGFFIDRASPAKVAQASFLSLVFGLFLFDADLDGFLDLLLANGHLSPEVDQLSDGIRYRQAAQLFMNQGDGTFRDVGPELGGVLEEKLVARGAAYGDYDKDGDLDVLVTENGGPAHLWRNDMALGNSLRLHLEGRESNRSALGAEVVAVIGQQRQVRRVRSGSSYLSQNEKAATFGLGQAEQADTVIVTWPGGRVDRFSSVQAGAEYRLVEGSGRLVPTTFSPTVAGR